MSEKCWWLLNLKQIYSTLIQGMCERKCSDRFYSKILWNMSLSLTPLNVKVEGTDSVYSGKNTQQSWDTIVWNKAKSASNLASIKKLSSIVYR